MPQPTYIFRGNEKTQRDTLGLNDTFRKLMLAELTGTR